MNTFNGHSNNAWLALLFVAVSAVCMLAETSGKASGESSSNTGGLWRSLTALLWLMATNILIQGDLWFISWMRDVSRAGGWYEVRRPLQAVTLAILAVGSVVVFDRKARSSKQVKSVWLPVADRLAGGGMLLLLLIVSLRFISLHQTDQVINMSVAGPSLGRWVEMVGLVLVGVGALHRSLRPHLERP